MESHDNYLKTALFQLTSDNTEISEFIANAALDGMSSWNLQNPEEAWMSPRLLTILGYDPEEMLHTSDAWKHIIFQEDLETALQNLQHHLQEPSQPYNQIVRYRHKDGSTVWVRAKGMAILDKKGVPLHMLGTHIDVTREQLAQRENAQVLDHYQAIIDNQAVYIVKISRDGTYAFANDFYCRDLGLERKKLMGKQASNFLVAEDISKFRAMSDRCIAQPGLRFRETLSNLLPDGSRKTGDWEFAALCDKAGNPHMLLGIGRDITEELDSKRELERNQEIFRFIAENTSDGLLLFEYGKVAYVSPSYLRILGYSAETEKKRTQEEIFDLIHPEDRPGVEQLIAEKLSKREKTFTYRFRALHKQGHYVWREDEATITYDASGEAARSVLVARDISQDVRQEEELGKKQQELLDSVSQLEKSETELKKEREKLKYILGQYEAVDATLNKSTLVSIADKHGRIIKANARFCEVSGYSEDELLGHNHCILNSGYHPKEFWADMWKTITARDIWHAEVCNRAKDGSLYWVDTVINPIMGDHGQIEQFLSIRTLITERKMAEGRIREAMNQLEEKNLELQGVMAASKIGTWKYFISENKLYWDQHMAGMLESEDCEEQGVEYFKSLIHPDDRQRIKERLQDLLEDKEPFDVEYRVTLPGGTERILVSKGFIVFGEDDKQHKIIGTTQDITDKRLAEREMIYMQHILDQAGDIGRIGAWSIDLKKHTLYWSRVTREIHEVPDDFVPEVKKGINFYKQGHSRDMITKVVERSIESGTPFDEELELITSSGKEIWVRAIGTSECENGVCVRLFGTFQDITQQVEATHKIEQAQRFSRQLLDNMLEGFSVIDCQNTQIQVNKAFCEMTGFTEKELVGQQPPFSYWPEEEHENIEKAFNTTLETGIGFFELVFKRKDGSRFPVFVAAGALKDQEGNITNYFANISDISDRKQAESELKQTRDILDQTSKVARVGGWDFDLPTRKVKWTEAIKDIHEVDYDFEPSFESVLNFHIPESLEKLHKAIEQAMSDGTPYDLELQITTAKGNKVWTRALGSAEFQNGECVRLFGTVQDINEQKKDKEALIQAKAHAEAASIAKSDFLANMSHEIRTPLNSVIGFTDLLVKTKLNDSQRNYMEYVYHSANSLLDLINDILDFSKIEAGKLELSPIKTDIWELSHQIVDIVRYKTNEKGIELILDISTEVPQYANLDPVRIRQVLVNLVSNAVKFTEKGHIRLEISLANSLDHDFSELLFAVDDTGIGIPKAHQQKIFEAFTQEDASTTRKFGGTGLGLSISNSLLKLMDSQLDLQSQVGEGSRFFFTLTVPTEQGDVLGNLDNLEMLQDIKHILIVDDNELNCKILKQMLALKNIPCSVALNAFQALDIMESKMVDVIITDYHMPHFSGLELVQKIRSNPRFGPDQVSIVLLHSVSNDAGLSQQCKEYQIQKVINKPITALQLFGILASLKTDALNLELSASKQEADEKAASAEDHLFLVVDDNVVNRVLARSMIRQVFPNADIQEAVNGKEAIEMFFRIKPSLVLMDVQMPEVSGYEATRIIREKEKDSSTPIIALTAGTLKGEEERCMQAGMNAYMSKPIVAERLKSVLSQWLDKNIDAEIRNSEEDLTENLITFDRQKFVEKLENNEELMKVIMSEFIIQLDEFEENLKVNAHSGKKEFLKSVCHKIRGSAGSLQMNKLAYLARDLEEKSGNMADMRFRVEEIMDELTSVRNEAENFMAHS